MRATGLSGSRVDFFGPAGGKSGSIVSERWGQIRPRIVFQMVRPNEWQQKVDAVVQGHASNSAAHDRGWAYYQCARQQWPVGPL